MTTFATAAINEYDDNIARIEEQIQQLQDILSQQQSERQNVQSIEQMGMSAIGQIVKTLAACNHAGLPQLANSFKKQAIATLNDSSDEAKAEPLAPSVTATAIVPSAVIAADENASDDISDDDILETVKALDEEHLTDNYLPIFLYRASLPQLTRQQQDEILYRLEASDRIELSTLQEVRAYTPEQIKAGIPQGIGGPLFFIIVSDSERVQPVKATVKPTVSVGAAAAADIAIMDFNELKTYCLETLGLNKEEVRKHGKLTRRDTWASAAKHLS